VPENASIGMHVLKVRASDADSGANGRLRYSIVSGDSDANFAIDNDGELKVSTALDYERRNNYRLTLRVEDGGADTGSEAK